MGAAVGDIDSDGDLDLYVSGFGANTLYRNNGDGTFRDVTRDAGLVDARWSTSAAFVDYDRDGDLDLYVGQLRRLHDGRQQDVHRPGRRARLLRAGGVAGGSRPSPAQ